MFKKRKMRNACNTKLASHNTKRTNPASEPHFSARAPHVLLMQRRFTASIFNQNPVLGSALRPHPHQAPILKPLS